LIVAGPALEGTDMTIEGFGIGLHDVKWHKVWEECVGCTPISEPTTITEPGCYYVTCNIEGTGTEVITIAADNVSLDLKDHTLSLPQMSGHSPVRIASNVTNISVRNGTLFGGDRGVRFDWATGDPRPRVYLRNLTVREYTYCGIYLEGVEQLDLLDCRIMSRTSHGVRANHESDQPFTGHFLRNTFRNADSLILALRGLHGGLIHGNQLTGEADAVGIGVFGTATGNIIEGNTITSVHGHGIQVEGFGHLVANNTVNNGWLSGILVNASDCRVVGNVVRGWHQSGIKVDGSRNLIEDNQANAQVSGSGLEFVGGSANVYRNNVFLGNPAGGVQDPFGNTDAGGNIV
jgi:hypothetical protein